MTLAFARKLIHAASASSTSENLDEVPAARLTTMPTTASSLRSWKHAQSITKIDADLHYLENRVLQLKAERNRLIPIGELPTEILIRIFGLVQVANGRITTADILPITWASRHWRDVAIACPWLWSHIDRSCYAWLDECLERSGNCYISVLLVVKRSRDEDALDAVLDEAFSRITSLEILCRGIPDPYLEDDSNQDYPQPLSVKQPPHPFLESLTLRKTEVPSSFFPGLTPQLRRLDVTDSHFSCESLHNFTGLTHLTIKHPFRLMQLYEILGVLSNMPLLEEIVLAMIYDWENTEVNDDVLPSPNLLNLTSLHLKDVGHDFVLGLLQQVVLPDVVNIRICVRVYTFNSSRLSDMIDVINRRFPASRPIRAFAMRLGYGTSLTLQFYASATWDTSEIHLKVGVDVEQDNFSSGSWLASSLCSLPLDSVQTIYLESCNPIPQGIWNSLLTPLVNVREVHVNDQFAHDFTNYLAYGDRKTWIVQRPPGSESVPTQDTIFPAMEKFVLGFLPIIPGETLLSKLADAIATRRKTRLREVIAKRTRKGYCKWEPVVGKTYDLVVDKTEPPCVFEKFEEGDKYPISDSEASDDD